MKYDDASWHYGGNFPAELPDAAGGTHIGMFVAWCFLNGLEGESYTDDLPDACESLRTRETTPGAWFLEACDQKFVDDVLSEDGNAFARDYYAKTSHGYMEDYAAAVGRKHPTLYHVPDTWDTYEKLSPVISRRFKQWKHPRKWWQVWR